MNFGFYFRQRSKQKIKMDSDASLIEKYRFKNVFIAIEPQLGENEELFQKLEV